MERGNAMTTNQTLERIEQAAAICRNCGQPIHDGELVIDTWNGEPLEHINCATVRMTLEEVVR
jgi:hypothetical protein